MPARNETKPHTRLEDWVMIVLGTVAAFTPWLVAETPARPIALATFAIGTMIALVGLIELIRLLRIEEILHLALGAFLAAAPWLFGYPGTELATWHHVIGAVTMLLALVELWQDWSLTDDGMETGRH